MKKKIYRGLVVIIILLLSLTFFYGKKELNLISSKEYFNILEESNDKLIYVGRPSCSDCAELQPILEKELSENDIKAYYYNTEKAKKKSMDNFNAIKEKINIEHVPIIIRYNGDREIERYEFSKFKEDTDSLNKFIEKYKSETNS